MHAQAASKKQDQNNQDDCTYTPYRIVTPVFAVTPYWKTSDKRYDKNYRKNEHEHHVLAPALTASIVCFSAASLADSATRGCAISFVTLARSALSDSLSYFVFGMVQGCHHARINDVQSWTERPYCNTLNVLDCLLCERKDFSVSVAEKGPSGCFLVRGWSDPESRSELDGPRKTETYPANQDSCIFGPNSS